jgi:hypothetical protein
MVGAMVGLGCWRGRRACTWTSVDFYTTLRSFPEAGHVFRFYLHTVTIEDCDYRMIFVVRMIFFVFSKKSRDTLRQDDPDPGRWDPLTEKKIL